jgi:bacteriocin-like protein
MDTKKLKQLRKDAKTLNDDEFSKKYPGANRAQVRKMSEDDLQKITGGWVPIPGKW